MANSVVGLFDTTEHAHYAVRQLLAGGFDSRNISVVAADPGGTIRKETVDESGNLASAGAVSGAASGLLVGGLIGLLVGATTLAVPPVGFVVAGPIAGMLAGAGVGMVSGGLLGALIGLGIPEEEAHIYAESVRRGGVLVSVHVTGVDATRAEQILASSGAVNITERAAMYRSSGFTTYDPASAVYTQDEILAERARLGIVPAAIPGATVVEEDIVRTPNEILSPGLATYESTFQNHFVTAYPGGTRTFESVRPAYKFGYDAANRAEFRGLDWSVIEPQARLLWERANPATVWDHYRDAVHFGWTQGHAHVNSGGATLI
ncbi:MAG: general stress protein [Fimbriimonas sp.]